MSNSPFINEIFMVELKVELTSAGKNLEEVCG